MSTDLSNSAVQSSIEPRCLAALSEEIGACLRSETIRLGDGTTFQLDGVDRDASVLCEVFAHVGKLKDGQKKKLARDLLKLLAVEHSLGGTWRRVLCVTDQPAWNFLSGKSWCASVVREFRFEVFPVSLLPEERERICDAQINQADGIRRRPGDRGLG